MLWNVYHVRGHLLRGAGVSVRKLGRVRARHHPAAMLRAFAKWPDIPQRDISVRDSSAARLRADLRRAKRTLAEIRG